MASSRPAPKCYDRTLPSGASSGCSHGAIGNAGKSIGKYSENYCCIRSCGGEIGPASIGTLAAPIKLKNLDFREIEERVSQPSKAPLESPNGMDMPCGQYGSCGVETEWCAATGPQAEMSEFRKTH
jgi:hypothetical protein